MLTLQFSLSTAGIHRNNFNFNDNSIVALILIKSWNIATIKLLCESAITFKMILETNSHLVKAGQELLGFYKHEGIWRNKPSETADGIYEQTGSILSP